MRFISQIYHSYLSYLINYEKYCNFRWNLEKPKPAVVILLDRTLKIVSERFLGLNIKTKNFIKGARSHFREIFLLKFGLIFVLLLQRIC